MDSQALVRFNQTHIARLLDELEPAARTQLIDQIAEIDLALVDRLIRNEDQATDWEALASRAEPPPAIRLDDPSPPITRHDAVEAGAAALRAGRVGTILVAGGQGTRLGFAPPKGLFPIGPVSNRTLFQMHCDRLLAMMKRYDAALPLYIMTSPATDEETRRYFVENDRCGLTDEQLHIFCQGTMPAVDAQTGEILLASKHAVALSPDGHGGLVSAFAKHGCLEDAQSRGIEYLYYAQVDNPLAQLCDAELIGYHILARSQMTTQVVRKRFATERVGNVVSVDGKVQIIEYSDLPESAATQTLADGSLKLWAGNIAVHVFDIDFLATVTNSADGLPFHRALKKVTFMDAAGDVIDPEQPNAIKFERFIFDLLPMAERAIVVEGDASQVFAPVKNANGADTDTPWHAQLALSNLHHRWLQEAGAKLAKGVTVEIHPDWALDADEVRHKLSHFSEPVRFEADTLLR